MQIDCYGFEATSQWFRRRKLEPYLIRRETDATYVCFDDESVRIIHRIDRDTTGCIRQMWAFGKWDDATTLDYIPINQSMEIEDREIC